MDEPFGIDRDRALALAIAVAAGLAVFWIASVVFPYHSLNHDEGVYLQQASMLLDGQVRLYAGDLVDVFRPWFFVEDGSRLYPKYAPVPAAMFAVSMALFGEPRVTLAAVAAGNVALVYLLATTLFDRRVGLLAAATFAAAPMALVTTSVFLPYAPTTLLNLLFAVCYVRSVRDKRRDLALVAGAAIGTAFFARPYTAVLFAAPFIGHALWTIGRAVRSDLSLGDWFTGTLPEPIVRNALIAAVGLLGVAATLAYNAALTGAPLVFPYEAFAPLDGPGFGRREILGHTVEYTPALALESNGYALWYLATRWFTAGPFGTTCALVGAAIATGRLRRDDLGKTGFGVVILLGLVVTVVVGNVPFWGTHNMLGTLADPTDGLVSQFGPFYHFDLLVPLSIFAAVGAVAGGRRVRDAIRRRASRRRARVGILLLLAVTLPLVGAANATLAAEPLERGGATTEKYERAYAPFEDREESLSNALVFVPTPYGPWQNHPFQSLRNDPGFDGEVVYALNRGSTSRFAVIEEYPDRTHYRYSYRGEWAPDSDQHVTPKLERLAVREGTALDGTTRVGVPENVASARIRLTTDEGGRDGRRIEASVREPGEAITVEWSVARDGATVTAVDGSPAAVNGTQSGAGSSEKAESIPFDSVDELVMTVTLVQPDGSTLTYRQEATVRKTGSGVQVVWPPERRVCLLATDCGREGTYLPDRPDVHRDGVSFETELREQ
jgi:hypothetical protein